MTLKRFIKWATFLFWFSVATTLANAQSINLLQNPITFYRIPVLMMAQTTGGLSVMLMSSKRLKAAPISGSETRDTSYRMSPCQKA